jgi:hypothetical protein
VPAGGVTGVALAEDAGAEASPEADGEDDFEHATNPAPANSAQPASTDLRIVEDMERPSHRGTDRQLYAISLAPASPVRQAHATVVAHP